MIPLTKKYEPKSLKDLKGQDKAIKDLRRFIETFKKQKKKAALLYGPPGSGKTSAAYAIAKLHNLELLEVNASDFRNKDQIKEKVGSPIKQQSLFSKGKLILIDEIDGLSGREDRGGIPEISKLIQETTFPIILTATNPWDSKFSKLRNKSNLVKFGHLDTQPVYDILAYICKEEGIKFNKEVLKTLARRSGGDARAAINDLQNLTEKTKELTKQSLDEIAQREKTETMFTALTKIFKTTDPKIAIKAFDYVQEDLNQQFLWIDENLPKEYENPEDLARAYDKLSKADVFNRRIKRWQHWRFLVYINALLTAGIAVSKEKKYKKHVEYKPTGRILKLWWAKQKSMKKKAIALKIAQHTHSSTKGTLKYMDYYKFIFKKDKATAKNFIKEFDLNKEEVEWLRK